MLLLLSGVAVGFFAWQENAVAYYVSTVFTHGQDSYGLLSLCLVLIFLSPASSNAIGRHRGRVFVETFSIGFFSSIAFFILTDADLNSRDDRRFVVLASVLLALLVARLLSSTIWSLFLSVLNHKTIIALSKWLEQLFGTHAKIHGKPTVLTTQFILASRRKTNSISKKAIAQLRKNKDVRAEGLMRELSERWRTELDIYKWYNHFIFDDSEKILPIMKRFEEVFAVALELEMGLKAKKLTYSRNILNDFISVMRKLHLRLSGDLRIEFKSFFDWDVLQDGYEIKGGEWASMKSKSAQPLQSEISTELSGFYWSVLAYKLLEWGLPHWSIKCLEDVPRSMGMRSHVVLSSLSSQMMLANQNSYLEQTDEKKLEEFSSYKSSNGGVAHSSNYRRWGPGRISNGKLPFWDIGLGPGLVMSLIGACALILSSIWSSENNLGDIYAPLNDIHRDQKYNNLPLVSSAIAISSGNIIVADIERNVFSFNSNTFEFEGPYPQMNTSSGSVDQIATDKTSSVLASKIVNDESLAGVVDVQVEVFDNSGAWKNIIPFGSVEWFVEKNILDAYFDDDIWCFALVDGIVTYNTISRKIRGYKTSIISDFKWSSAESGLGIINGDLNFFAHRYDYEPTFLNICAHKVKKIEKEGHVLCEEGELHRFAGEVENLYGGKQFDGKNLFEEGLFFPTSLAHGVWMVRPKVNGVESVSFRSFDENRWKVYGEYEDLVLEPRPLLSGDGKQLRIAKKEGGYVDFYIGTPDHAASDGISIKESDFDELILSWDAYEDNFLVASISDKGVKRLRKAAWGWENLLSKSLASESKIVKRYQETLVEGDFSRIIPAYQTDRFFLASDNGLVCMYDFNLGGAVSSKFPVIPSYHEGSILSLYFNKGDKQQHSKGYFLCLDSENNLWKTEYNHNGGESSPGQPTRINKISLESIDVDLTVGIEAVLQLDSGLEFWLNTGDKYQWMPKIGWSDVETEEKVVGRPYFSSNTWFALTESGRVISRGMDGWNIYWESLENVKKIVPSDAGFIFQKEDSSWWQTFISNRNTQAKPINLIGATNDPLLDLPISLVVPTNENDLMAIDKSGVVSYSGASLSWRRLFEFKDNYRYGEDGLLEGEWMATKSAGKTLFFNPYLGEALVLKNSSFSNVQKFSDVKSIVLEDTGQLVCLFNNGRVEYHSRFPELYASHEGEDVAVLQEDDNDVYLNRFEKVVDLSSQPLFLSESGKIYYRESELHNYKVARESVSDIASNGETAVWLDDSGDLVSGGESKSMIYDSDVVSIMSLGDDFFYTKKNGAAYLYRKSPGSVSPVPQLLAGGEGSASFKEVYGALSNKEDLVISTDKGLLYRSAIDKRLVGVKGSASKAQVESFLKVGNRIFGYAKNNDLLEIIWIPGQLPLARIILENHEGINVFQGQGGRTFVAGISGMGIMEIANDGQLGSSFYANYSTALSENILLVIEHGSRVLLVDDMGQVADYNQSNHLMTDAGYLGIRPSKYYKIGVSSFILGMANGGQQLHVLGPPTLNGKSISIDSRKVGPSNIVDHRVVTGENGEDVLVLIGDRGSVWRFSESTSHWLEKKALARSDGKSRIMGVIAIGELLHLLDEEQRYYTYDPFSGDTQLIATSVVEIFPHRNTVAFHLQAKEEYASEASINIYNAEGGYDTVYRPSPSTDNIEYTKNKSQILIGSGDVILGIVDKRIANSSPIASFKRSEYSGENVVSSFSGKDSRLFAMSSSGRILEYEISRASWEEFENKPNQKATEWQKIIVLDGMPAAALAERFIYHYKTKKLFPIEGAPLIMDDQIYFLSNESLQMLSPSGFYEIKNWAQNSDLSLLGGQKYFLGADYFLHGNGRAFIWDNSRNEFIPFPEGDNGSASQGSTPIIFRNKGQTDSFLIYQAGLLKHEVFNSNDRKKYIQRGKFLGHSGDSVYFLNGAKSQITKIDSGGNASQISYRAKDFIENYYLLSLLNWLKERIQPVETTIELRENGFLFANQWGKFVLDARMNPFFRAYDNMAEKLLGNKKSLPEKPRQVRKFETFKMFDGSPFPQDCSWDLELGRKMEDIVTAIGSYENRVAVMCSDEEWRELDKVILRDKRISLPRGIPNFQHEGSSFSRNGANYSFTIDKNKGLAVNLGEIRKGQRFSIDEVGSFFAVGGNDEALILDENNIPWIWVSGARRNIYSGACKFVGLSEADHPVFEINNQEFVWQGNQLEPFSQIVESVDYMKRPSESFGFSWVGKGLSNWWYDSFDIMVDVDGTSHAIDFIGNGFDFDIPLYTGHSPMGEIAFGSNTGLGRSLNSASICSVPRPPSEEPELEVVAVDNGKFEKLKYEKYFRHYLISANDLWLKSLRENKGQFSLGVPLRADSNGLNFTYLSKFKEGYALIEKSYEGEFFSATALPSSMKLDLGLEFDISLSNSGGAFLKNGLRAWGIKEGELVEIEAGSFPATHVPQSELKLDPKTPWDFNAGIFYYFDNKIALNRERCSFAIDIWTSSASEENVRLYDDCVMRYLDGRWISIRDAYNSRDVFVVNKEIPRPAQEIEFPNLSLTFNRSLKDKVAIDAEDSKEHVDFNISGGKFLPHRIRDVQILRKQILALSDYGIFEMNPQNPGNSSPDPKGLGLNYITPISNRFDKFLWRRELTEPVLVSGLNNTFIYDNGFRDSTAEEFSLWEEGMRNRSGEQKGLLWSRLGDGTNDISFESIGGLSLTLNRNGFVADQIGVVLGGNAEPMQDFVFDISGSLWSNWGYIGSRKKLAEYSPIVEINQVRNEKGESGVLLQTAGDPIKTNLVFWESSAESIAPAGITAREATLLKMQNGFTTQDHFFSSIKIKSPLTWQQFSGSLDLDFTHSLELMHRNTLGQEQWIPVLQDGLDFENMTDIGADNFYGANGFYSLSQYGVSKFSPDGELLDYKNLSSDSPKHLSRSDERVVLNQGGRQFEIISSSIDPISLNPLESNTLDVTTAKEFKFTSSLESEIIQSIEYMQPGTPPFLIAAKLIKGALTPHYYEKSWLTTSQDYLLFGKYFMRANDSLKYGLDNALTLSGNFFEENPSSIEGEGSDYRLSEKRSEDMLSNQLGIIKIMNNGQEEYKGIDYEQEAVFDVLESEATPLLTNLSKDERWSWAYLKRKFNLWRKENKYGKLDYQKVESHDGGLSIDYSVDISSINKAFLVKTLSSVDIQPLLQEKVIHSIRPEIESAEVVSSDSGFFFQQSGGSSQFFLCTAASAFKDIKEVEETSGSTFTISKSKSASFIRDNLGFSLLRNGVNGSPFKFNPGDIISNGKFSFNEVEDIYALNETVYVLTKTTLEAFDMHSSGGELLSDRQEEGLNVIEDNSGQSFVLTSRAREDIVFNAGLQLFTNTLIDKLYVDTDEISLPKDSILNCVLNRRMWTVRPSGIVHVSLEDRWLESILSQQ